MLHYETVDAYTINVCWSDVKEEFITEVKITNFATKYTH